MQDNSEKILCGKIWEGLKKACEDIALSMQDIYESFKILSGINQSNLSPLLKKRIRWREYQRQFISYRTPYPEQKKQIPIKNYLHSRRMMPHNPRDKREKRIEQCC